MPPTAGDRTLPRSFGGSPPATDRWPVPLATAFILALSLAGWGVLVQAGRLAASFLG